MKNALVIAMLLSLAGCKWVVKPDPIPAQCEPIGFEACKSQATWNADPADPNAWDALVDTLEDSRAETRQCEVRRKALAQCLQRLEKEGVIVP